MRAHRSCALANIRWGMPTGAKPRWLAGVRYLRMQGYARYPLAHGATSQGARVNVYPNTYRPWHGPTPSVLAGRPAGQRADNADAGRGPSVPPGARPGRGEPSEGISPVAGRTLRPPGGARRGLDAAARGYGGVLAHLTHQCAAGAAAGGGTC